MRKSFGYIRYIIKRSLLKTTSHFLSLFVHARAIPHQGKVCLFHTLKLGDSIVITPAMKAFLAVKRYDCYIVCSKEGRHIFRDLVPDERLIVYYPNQPKIIEELKAHQFDIIIDFHNSFLDLKRFFLPLQISHLYTYRAGFRTPWFFPWRYHRYVPWVSEARHELDAYLQLPQRLGLPIRDKSAYVPKHPHCQDRLRQKLTDPHHQPVPSQWITIHLPALGRRKRWPQEHFVDLCQRLLKNSHLSIIFTGLTNEKHLVDPVANQLPQERVHNLAGELSFAEFVEVIRMSHLLISVDTCAIHIAYATQTPTLALFGPSNEEVWRPYNTKNQTVLHSHIECRPCDKNFQNNENCSHVNCMKQLTVDMVYQAAIEKLYN